MFTGEAISVPTTTLRVEWSALFARERRSSMLAKPRERDFQSLSCPYLPDLAGYSLLVAADKLMAMGIRHYLNANPYTVCALDSV